jgi:anti-sigma factor RsiW
MAGIESYLGGTMSPARRRSFDRHLTRCSECREELRRCREENSLFRKALTPKRLSSPLRYTVLARAQREYVPVRTARESGRKLAVGFAPVAAVALFLIAFWVAGMLVSSPVSIQETPSFTASGKFVTVNWVEDIDRYRYFSIKRGSAMPGAEPALKDMQVD